MIFTGALVLLQALVVSAAWIARLSGVDLSALYPDVALVLPSGEGMLGATAFGVLYFMAKVHDPDFQARMEERLGQRGPDHRDGP